MTRSKHRLDRRRHHVPTPIERALEHVPLDLDDIIRLWPRAVEQLDLRVDVPPRIDAEPTAEAIERRRAEDRAVREERIINAAYYRIQPPSASPAPTHMRALDDLAIAQGGLFALGDLLTIHCRRGDLDPDGRPGPHRLTASRRQERKPVGKHELDHLGYLYRLGYGMRVTLGRDIDTIGARHDNEPAMAAAAWIRVALRTVDNLNLADHIAAEVRRIRGRIRTVIGLPDMQVRLAPCCFVCQQPALRMNVDKLYVECRNADCTPVDAQCTFFGPHGEPRWYRNEWGFLSKELGVDIDKHLLQLLGEQKVS